MTDQEFRETPSLRDGLAGALQNEALLVALDVIKSKNETVPVPPGLSGIDVAAAFSERQTRAIVVHELQVLSTPMPERPAQNPPENLGTEFTIEDFDNDPTKKT